MIAAREFTSEAEMRAAARAAHIACYNPRKVARPLLPAPEPSVRIVRINHVPEWKRRWVNFDAHVQAYQWYRANLGAKKAVVYIKRRCEELGADYDLVVGPNKSNPIVAVRQVIMFELRTEMKISLPEIGRVFGGRDHSTVIHAVNKIAAMRAGA
jgi:hypothetical protein